MKLRAAFENEITLPQLSKINEIAATEERVE